MISIDHIIEQQNQSEKIVFQRPLHQVMQEDYILSDEILDEINSGKYAFPVFDVNFQKYVDQSKVLIRTQDNFSFKVHYIDTEVYFHKHNFLELIYVYKGECTNYIEESDNRIVLHENEMILINQNVVHAIEKISPDDIVLKMVLPVEFLREGFSYEKIDCPILKQFFFSSIHEKCNYYGYLVFRHKSDSQIRIHIEQMLREFFYQKPFYDIAIKHLFSLLLVDLVRNQMLEENAVYSIDEGKVPIQKIIQEINISPKEATLQYISKKYGYSESYLSREIHRITGDSFRKLQEQSRFKYAVYLLQMTDLSLDQVAQACGYSNVNNLYRMVKRNTNCSLLQIKRNVWGE